MKELKKKIYNKITDIQLHVYLILFPLYGGTR
jgi:hypothetical protein